MTCGTKGQRENRGDNSERVSEIEHVVVYRKSIAGGLCTSGNACES